jgi:F-type H+-transporting ATPase subunit alpha
MNVGEQIAILYCGTNGLMHEVPVTEVRKCQDLFLEKMRSAHSDVIDLLASGKIDDNATCVIKSVMADIAGQFK